MSGTLPEEFLQFLARIDTSKGGPVSPSAGVGQNIAEAVRPVFFMTDLEDFLYATHGGTLFLVEYEGRLYGLTCRHVFKDFSPDRLFVTSEKFAKKGSPPARIKRFGYPDAPKDGAVGTDITDLCVIEFADDVTQDFFRRSAYVVNADTIATAREGHPLLVAGVLKDKTSILPPDINIGYCRLEFQDAGVGTSDPFLRSAIAEFSNPSFDNPVGLSGSPVFDQVQGRLCGMVMRGGMKGSRCILHYLDIFDIAHALKVIRAGAASTYYAKGLLVREDFGRRSFLDEGSSESDEEPVEPA